MLIKKQSSSQTTNFLLLLFSAFFCLFIINLVCNTEKSIYLNELFSLTGFLIAVYLIFKRQLNKSSISYAIYFLIGYGAMRAIISLPVIDSTYGYLRNLVLWYSIFSFFLGAMFIKYLKPLYNSRSFNSIAIGIYGITLVTGNSIATPSVFPIIFRRYKLETVFIFLALIISYLRLSEATLAVDIFAFLIFSISLKFQSLKKIVLHPLCFTIGLFLFFCLFMFCGFHWGSFYISGYEVLPLIDADILWRLMFGTYIFFQHVLTHSIFGIGFGTPIFYPDPPLTHFIIVTNSSSNPYFAYVIGSHNFIVYVFARLGVIGLIPFILIYLNIFKKMRLIKYSNLSKALFFSFIFITIGAFCNVVLPTPVYASTYWIILGMLYESLKNDEENQH